MQQVRCIDVLIVLKELCHDIANNSIEWRFFIVIGRWIVGVL